MRIGQLSEMTGISQRMLRYYEQEGLLNPKRTDAGYRIYDEHSVTLVKHIRNLNEAGMKLEHIKILLPCLSGKDSEPRFVGCPKVKAVLKGELDKLDRKLSDLADSRNSFARFLRDLIPEA